MYAALTCYDVRAPGTTYTQAGSVFTVKSGTADYYTDTTPFVSCLSFPASGTATCQNTTSGQKFPCTFADGKVVNE